MNEAALNATPHVPTLESLREAGAQHVDPARFFYIEVLSRRVSQAGGELQQVLQVKLDAALTDYAGCVRAGAQAGDAVARSPLSSLSPSPATPLAQLNRHIREATQPESARQAASGQAHVELKSVRRFREVWSRIAAADQVDQAMGRGPENAGPLNSHMLVLRSLALMRTLSPHYLRRFMSHVDSLLWLDGQGRTNAPAQARPVRRARPKKQG